MKLLLAALVFVLILSCIAGRKDYSIVDNVPQGNQVTQADVAVNS